MADLRELIDQVAEGWEFNSLRYPGMQDANREEKRGQTIRHILIHIGVENGDLLKVVERYEHGKMLSDGDLRTSGLKLFKDVLRLVSVIGLTADELAKHCEPKKSGSDPSHS
jgi:hypothetical protein